MNFKRFHESKNICPSVGWVYGQYRSGVWESTSGRMTSPWISIEGDKAYYLSINDNGLNAIAWINLNYFDENQNWLGSRVTLGMEPFTETSKYIATPEFPTAAKYLRVVLRGYKEDSTALTPENIVLSNIQVNEGSQLPYEPYDNEVWHDIPHYIHKTATDTLTLPAVIYPNDTSITVGIKGQSSQNGTPTPDNPVMPQGTGERTAQLFEYAQNATATTINTVVWTIANGVIHGSGTTTSQGGQDCILVTKTGLQRNTNYPAYLSISAARDLKLPAGTYTFSYNAVAEPTAKANKPRLIVGHNGASVNKGTATEVYNGDTFTCDGDDYVALTINTTTGYDTYEFGDFMLNSGSTPQPYEPYGYKIPILIGGNTINKYLGTEQTIRQIKKLVLTGEEDWWEAPYAPSPSLKRYGLTLSSTVIIGSRDAFCTHYAATTVSNDSIQIGSNMKSLYISDNENGATLSDWKTYLQQQYAAGTPVTIWYVLATPQTAITNEPLMKIGTYADSLTTSIPVTAGENTLDVQTTVAPSEVTAGFSGWHPVQSVHECENGQWD